MFRSNDCIKLTKDYLKNYSYRQQAVRNIELDMQDLNRELADVSVRAVDYRPSTSSGASELNGTEQQAHVRALQEQEVKALQVNRRRLQTHLEKMENSLGRLPDDEQKILRKHYIEHYTYAEIGEELGLSERSCQRKANEATRSLAIMLFHDYAEQDVFFIGTTH
jgi:RNA polymerase sigma factor (sigma-70 family)